ncbi:MAG TPA: hypothetical protein VM934_02905 [Pyrinomonadaceae bacterium]|jgi:hypothetical protein|nr:hypothetical protein [Pyrinomonadaceae bacterium]
MGDWIGLGIIVLVLAGGLFGLSHLGRPSKPISQDEYERRIHEGRGTMSAGVMAGMHALQKLMNPKAAEAIEVQKDLRAGYYDDQQEVGDGDEPDPTKEARDESSG